LKFRNSEINRGIVGLSFGVASISGSIAAFYSELFDTRIRYTGLVFAKEVSGAVVGGFTPLISTLLVQWSGDASWPVSVYMMVTALAAFWCAYLARDILDVGQRNVTTATKRDALVGVRQVMDDTGDHAR
jgi:MHS family shikimate/dehydroshikimate transporter-like MFS transporter